MAWSRAAIALSFVLAAAPSARADLRSTVYASVVARSGLKSNCSAFAALFADGATYEMPVGAPPAVGRPAIVAACEEFNTDVVGAAGSGWYPGALFSSSAGDKTTFQLQVRTVGVKGCKVDINGIVVLSLDPVKSLITRFEYFYDSEWNAPDINGSCTT